MRVHGDPLLSWGQLFTTVGQWILGILLVGLVVLYGSAELLAQSAPTARQLKEEVLVTLDQIQTTDKRVERAISKASEEISRSLSYFLDDSRVSDNKVFEREQNAVSRLLKAVKRKHLPLEIMAVLQEAIDDLVEADRRIAELSIITAQQLTLVSEINARKLRKAEREYDKALLETNPRIAIERFEEAWELSQKVVQERDLVIVITDFDDISDPFSPSLATNTLTATFRIVEKGRGHDDDDRGKKYNRDDRDDDDDEGERRYRRGDRYDDDKQHDRFVLEFVEIIRNSSNDIVRTLTSHHEVPDTPKALRRRKEHSFEVTVTSEWDGLDSAGKVVPDGTYSYLAFGKLLTVKEKQIRQRGRRGGGDDDDDNDDDDDGKNGKGVKPAVSFPVVGTIMLDGTSPIISATVTPQPNIRGWNNSDVTVSFTAGDSLAGVANITPPVQVTSEGAGQIVTGTVSDEAGNTATVNVTVNLDKTPPAVSVPEETTVAAIDAFGTPATDTAIQSFLGAAGAQDNLAGSLTPTNDAPLEFSLGSRPVSFTATDPADNTGMAVATMTVADLTPPEVTPPSDVPVVIDQSIGASSTIPQIAAFLTGATAVDNVDGVVQPTNNAPAIFPFGSTVVTFTGTDAAGNEGTATATVTVQDLTPPVISITKPANLSLFNVTSITVTGTIDDPTATLIVNGVVAQVSGGLFEAEGVALVDGSTSVEAIATDPAGNQAQASITVRLLNPPDVTITQPDNLEVLNQNSVEVTGTVDDPEAQVTVNEVPANVIGGVFTAVNVQLREGNNVITATATDASGTVGTASIRVTRDTTPPLVTIDSPEDGFITGSDNISVTGMINDIVVGTVNGDQAQVTVNGVAAQVANRGFLAAGVPLALGENTIVATGTDVAANSATASITVFRQVIQEPNISIVSGNNQTAPIGSELEEPIVVQLQDGMGNPVPDKSVIFKVTRNNGFLNGSGGQRSLVVTSNEQGLAEVQWTLGARAGAGNNVVEATAVGFVGKATFVAIAESTGAAKINIDAGNNQTGVVGQPLPRPIVAVVTDAGHNRVAGVPVTFTALQGGGHFNGQSSVTVNTDSDGRALAVLVLGPEEGIDNNLVEANFPGNSGLPASFVASGKPAGDPAATAISGVVLDNTNQPIEGVTMHVHGTSLHTETDAQGQFLIQPAPVGTVFLIADGSTAQRPGVWPTLEYELVTIPGHNNTVGMPIYMLPLDIPSGLFVDETTGGTLTLSHVPGFSLTVAPGSATFPDGSRSGTVSVTVVNADKVPMTPNFGQQPRLVVTIQPAGVHFDPPAAMTIPNVDGLAPGEVTEMYSFDHDQGQFVSIGTGSASADGTVIKSDPGVGIIKGGWHAAGNPVTTGDGEPVFVKIDSPAPFLVGLDTPRAITATGGPGPGRYFWSDSGSVGVVSSNGSRAQIVGDGLGPGEIKVRFVSENGAEATASIPASTVDINLATDTDGDGKIDHVDDDIEFDFPGKPVAILDKRAELTLGFVEDPALNGAILRLWSTPEGLTVWTAEEGGEQVPLPQDYRIGSDPIPQKLYVSAVEPNLHLLHWTLFLPDGETEVHEDSIVLNLIKIEFVNAAGDDQESGTSFSHPYPVVELDPITNISFPVKDFPTHEGDLLPNIRFDISGKVTDPIADLVEGATISQVFVGYVDQSADHPEFNPPHFIEIPIPVTPLAEPKSDLRPHAFRGEFNSTITIPWRAGNAEVVVRSDKNAIGHSGYGTFSIPAGRLKIVIPGGIGDETETPEDTSTTFFQPEVYHKSSPPGLVNPIRIFITDKSVTTAEQVNQLKVDYAGQEYSVVLDGDRLRVDTVLMGLHRDPDLPQPAANLINVVTQNGPTTVRYLPLQVDGPNTLSPRTVQRDLHWSYAIQPGVIDAAEQPNYPKYAAGTTVDHILHFSLLNTDLKKEDISFQHIGANGREHPEVPRSLQVEEVEKLLGPPDVLEKYRIRIKIGKGTLGPKQLVLRLQTDQNLSQEQQSMVIRGGRFGVVPLKTFIVGVDGLAYERAREVVGVAPSQQVFSAFPMLFETSPNSGPEDFALSPLPSITHTGWTGIFSGLPPKDHGIQGNSYFSRNIVGLLPFASDGEIDIETHLANLGVVQGSLHGRVRNPRGSLYENIARVAERSMTVWSVHSMYANDPDAPNVKMTREFFGLDLKYRGHDPTTAETLDRDTGTFAAKRFASHSGELDFLTTYFPGPDNVAHAVGAGMPSFETGETYSATPEVGQVNIPLDSIREQAARTTDPQLGRVVNEIVDRGYLNAMLFVLIADHGLHAFRNDDEHNIFLAGRLNDFFIALGLEPWRGTLSENIDDQTIVYSGNGGMAHIYLRSEGRTWQQSPRDADIFKVARQLLIEATGGRPRGRQLPRCALLEDIRTKACEFIENDIIRLTNLAPVSGKKGELGALGDPPALFVRVGGFGGGFKWVKDVGDDPNPVILGTIEEFLTARKEIRYAPPDNSLKYPNFDWPEFAQRIQELDDTNSLGSRTGDILLFTDGRSGYLTVNKGDQFNGWHGGATISESRVPMMMNMGPAVVDKNDLINKAINKSKTAGRRLRNWELSKILENLYKELKP